MQFIDLFTREKIKNDFPIAPTRHNFRPKIIPNNDGYGEKK